MGFLEMSITLRHQEDEGQVATASAATELSYAIVYGVPPTL
jgi:hypothetical protein